MVGLFFYNPSHTDGAGVGSTVRYFLTRQPQARQDAPLPKASTF
jgi:hypothetical protein